MANKQNPEIKSKNFNKPSQDNQEAFISNTSSGLNHTQLEPSYTCDHCKRGFYTSSLFIHHVAVAHKTPRALSNRMSSKAFDAPTPEVGEGGTAAFVSNGDTRSSSFLTEKKK